MFWTLSNARQHGMDGPQPISMSDIMAFCALAAIPDPQDRMAILYAVQAMDAEFLKATAERQKQKERPKQKGMPK